MSAKPNMSAPTARSDALLRPISFGDPAVSIDRRDDGTIYLRPKIALGEYPVRLTDRLHHWAKAEPNRIFMAERAADGGWRKITYAQLLASSRRIASSLLARDLSAEKPAGKPLGRTFHTRASMGPMGRSAVQAGAPP